MTDTLSRFVDVLIVVEMNFFLLESSDESFSISILPRPPSVCYGNLNPRQGKGYMERLKRVWRKHLHWNRGGRIRST